MHSQPSGLVPHRGAANTSTCILDKLVITESRYYLRQRLEAQFKSADAESITSGSLITWCGGEGSSVVCDCRKGQSKSQCEDSGTLRRRRLIATTLVTLFLLGSQPFAAVAIRTGTAVMPITDAMLPKKMVITPTAMETNERWR